MTFYITLKANIKVYYHLKAIRIETHFCQTKTGYFFIDQINHHKVKDEGPLSITRVIFLYSFIGYLRYLEDYRHAPFSLSFLRNSNSETLLGDAAIEAICTQ